MENELRAEIGDLKMELAFARGDAMRSWDKRLQYKTAVRKLEEAMRRIEALVCARTQAYAQQIHKIARDALEESKATREEQNGSSGGEAEAETV